MGRDLQPGAGRRRLWLACVGREPALGGGAALGAFGYNSTELPVKMPSRTGEKWPANLVSEGLLQWTQEEGEEEETEPGICTKDSLRQKSCCFHPQNRRPSCQLGTEEANCHLIGQATNCPTSCKG